MFIGKKYNLKEQLEYLHRIKLICIESIEESKLGRNVLNRVLYNHRFQLDYSYFNFFNSVHKENITRELWFNLDCFVLQDFNKKGVS